MDAILDLDLNLAGTPIARVGAKHVKSTVETLTGRKSQFLVSETTFVFT
jgi:hypothetical protein